MNVSELIKLIDAGYTKEEIQAMAAPAPAPDPAPDPAPAPAPAPDPVPDNMAAMLQELKDLKKAVFAMNVMNTDIPAPKSVDDILAKAMEGGK